MSYKIEVNPTSDFRYIVAIYDEVGLIGKLATFQNRSFHNENIFIDQIFFQNFSNDTLNIIIQFLNHNNQAISKNNSTIFNNINFENLTYDNIEKNALQTTPIERKQLDGYFLPKNLIVQQLRQLSEKRVGKLTNGLFKFQPVYELETGGLFEWYDATSMSEYPKSLLDFHKEKVEFDNTPTESSVYISSLFKKDSYESKEIEKVIQDKDVRADMSFNEYYDIVSNYLNQERFIKQEKLINDTISSLSDIMKKLTIPGVLRITKNVVDDNFDFKHQEYINRYAFNGDFQKLYELCYGYTFYKSFHIMVEQILSTTTNSSYDIESIPKANQKMLEIFNNMFLQADEQIEFEITSITTSILSAFDERLCPYATLITLEELRSLPTATELKIESLLRTLKERTKGYVMYNSQIQEEQKITL